jgi:hypothetical protein
MSRTVYVKFTSHRARKRGLWCLDPGNTQSYWSTKRNTGKGVYRVNESELERLKTSELSVGFTVLRGPYDDLMECWG